MKLLGAGVTLDVRLHRTIFFRHNPVVRFKLCEKKQIFKFQVTLCSGDVGVKTPPYYFLQALPKVRFSLRVKVLRFRFEVTWYRGDFGGKTPQIDCFQALPSTALYVACEGTTFQF